MRNALRAKAEERRTGLLAVSLTPSYQYQRAAKETMSVSEWKRTRFSQTYTGFAVAVLDGEGMEVKAGQTLFGSVRDSYV